MELVASVLLAAAVFHEHIGSRVALGTTLVVSGGAVLAWSATPELRLGALLVIAACGCWAVDNCVTAELDELAPHHITLAKGAVAGVANLAIGLMIASAPSIGSIVAGLVIGALGYGVSITLWVAGARDLGAARAQLIFAVAPFVGAAIVWIVLGEPVTVAQAVAVVLAGLGVATVMRSAHLHEHRHERWSTTTSTFTTTVITTTTIRRTTQGCTSIRIGTKSSCTAIRTFRTFTTATSTPDRRPSSFSWVGIVRALANSEHSFVRYDA